MMTKSVKFIIPVLFVLFNICLIIYPTQVLAAAREGLLLWFNNVLPSLLPFMVGISVLTGMGYVRLLSKWLESAMRILFNISGVSGFALIAGLISGYPIGAKTVAELRIDNQITQEEAQRLIGFCNNAGPLFIVGVAGSGLFGSAAVGYMLWASHVLAALLIGLGMGLISHKKPLQKKIKHIPITADFGVVLSNSIKNGMETMTFVGGTIIFFCVAAKLISMLVGEYGLLIGMLEATNGVKVLSQHATAFNVSAAAAVISFGGLSIHVQSAHFISKTDIKTAPYLLCKCIHAGLAAGICYFILNLQS